MTSSGRTGAIRGTEGIREIAVAVGSEGFEGFGGSGGSGVSEEQGWSEGAGQYMKEWARDHSRFVGTAL